MRILLLSTFCLFFCLTSKAQTTKIGFVYEDYILQNLPQTKKLQEEVDAQKKVYEAQLKTKVEKYQEKYLAYQTAIKDISTTTTESLNALLKEVQARKKEAEDAQAKAEEELRTMAEEKLIGIQNLIEKTEKIVAKEKAYTFVFRKNLDASGRESYPVLLYSANGEKDNLSDAIIIKLGGTPPVKK